MSLPLPANKEQPAHDCWVEFVGYVRDPLELPGTPQKVFAGNIFHVASKAQLWEMISAEQVQMGAQQGMYILKPELVGKTITPEELFNPSNRLFVPMRNIRYVETVIKVMTELPRVEEPGVPLTGQGVETKEHKPS